MNWRSRLHGTDADTTTTKCCRGLISGYELLSTFYDLSFVLCFISIVEFNSDANLGVVSSRALTEECADFWLLVVDCNFRILDIYQILLLRHQEFFQRGGYACLDPSSYELALNSFGC
jgi:hypothetical protein